MQLKELYDPNSPLTTVLYSSNDEAAPPGAPAPGFVGLAAPAYLSIPGTTYILNRHTTFSSA